ncbi:MAG: hypothetical protein P1U86_14605 [Verrucomicrobiales bacterium]|nr:hypothetical protein [Verrucomicrobiales bacterium]
MKSTILPLLPFLIGASLATAGDYDPKGPIVDKSPPPFEEKEIGVSLSFDAYSHFISYGADVWGDGSNAGNYGFNPSLEFSFPITDDLSLTLGTWWDVNDKGVSPIGGQLQEVDVWTGLAYDMGFVEVSTTYQQWIYGSQTEQILDFGFAFDLPLSPSVTVHNRLDAGASGGDTGTVVVVGAEHGFDLGPVSITLPVGVAFFATEGFHGVGGDTGFGYASGGINASVPMAFMDSALGGEWAFNAGVTYYHTDNSVTVNNPESDFIVTNFGVGVSF